MHDHDGRDQHIVVGVDGSAGSRSALCWAMAQARRTGATIEVISAWHVAALTDASLAGWGSATFDSHAIAAATQQYLDDMIASAARTDAQPPVKAISRAVHGNAAWVPLQASAGAQLLVVGRRGHGAFAGMLLGSVSAHCVQHATCPVVVTS